MSPRRSESVRRIAAIEALVCRDVGRKTQELIAASAGELAAAIAGKWSFASGTSSAIPRRTASFAASADAFHEMNPMRAVRLS